MIDIIIFENQIRYEVFENEHTLYFKSIKFFRNIRNEIIKNINLAMIQFYNIDLLHTFYNIRKNSQRDKYGRG